LATIDRIRDSLVALFEEPVLERRWLILGAALLAGCTRAPIAEIPHEKPAQVSTDLVRLKLILDGISASKEVMLYEGLPSEFWEPQLREREVNRKKTIGLHGYRFYDDRLPLQGSDADQFTALFSDRRSFQRYRSQKACGGYHPDYCIEWKKGDASTRALICLECGEVKFFAAQSQLYCDLSREAGQKLAQWLSSYRKNRPAVEPQA
jgi:hypothetical protein